MASRKWIETIFCVRRRPVSARPRRERDDWYIPLEVSRLEERRVLNVAPVLAGANNLSTVHQNQPATSNTGTQVAALIAGKVTDGDPGALSGIAVIAANNTNGTWQYSTDSGSNWTNFGTPTNTAARLLAADANTYVRFLPNADFSGSVSPGITFRAWDQTSGIAGGTADASSNGGTTAFSTASKSANLTVDQPLTTTGTATTSINDNQTVNPFNGVTIGDSISAAENITVTVTQSSTANGALSNLGGFTDNNDGTFTFTGTAAAATTALQGILFTPTAHQVAPSSTVDTTFTILATDSVTSTTDSSSVVHVTATNTAPTLSGANNLTAIQVDDTNSNGTLVSDLIAGKASDPDFGQTLGIAITATDTTHGSWDYTTDGGTSWHSVGSVANNKALLLIGDANTRVRFVPDAGFSGSVAPGITFRAWDGITGMAAKTANTNSNGGSTAFSSATASSSILVNDAPTLTGANGLPTINENDVTNTGSLVSALISGNASDVNGDPLGIAITAVDNTNGTWQYSINGGTNWTDVGSPTAGAALLLAGDANTRVRFVPAANFFGTSSITFQAWDETSGSTEGTADATVNGGATAFSTASASSTITVNAPPTITGTLAGQSTTDAASINPFSTTVISDPDIPAQTLMVTVQIGTPANGQFTAASLTGWATVTAGSTYSFTGTAGAATAAIQGLVFQPTQHQVNPGSTITTGLTVTANDQIAPVVSDSATTVVVTAANTAPTLSGANDLTAIQQNAINNNGDLVSALISGNVTDPDLGQTEGIAVTAVDGTDGTWQYSTDGGGSWSNIGPVGDGQALLLVGDALTRVRFVPDGTVSGTLTNVLTFRAWDGSSGSALAKVDTTVNGGSTAFSTATASSNILINDAPTITGANNLTTIVENPSSNPGTLVSALIAGQASDVNGNALGIAVTAVDNTNGNWQYSTDGGSNWLAFGSPSGSSARLLAADSLTLVRFVPNSNFFGASTITFQAWDQTSGSAGQTGNATINGGTSAFSTASATASITVHAPPSINGAGPTSIFDNQTTQPFQSVTVTDPDSATVTVTVTQTETANGSISNLGGFIDNGNGSFTFTGSSAAATMALQGLIFTPTTHQVVVGNIVDTHYTIVAGDSLTTTTDTNTVVHATAANDAPTLDSTKTQPFATITEDDVSNAGTTVASLLGTAQSDIDFGAIQGIAITATTVTGNGLGRWQFSTDGGTSWSDIGAVSDSSALLLRSTDLVRFLPDAKNGDTGAITFRAWDQTGSTANEQGTKVDASTNGGATPFSTATGTSNINVQDVNDAPVLDPTQTQPFTTITEDDVNNGGNTVTSLLGTSDTDVDTGAIQGIAITATTVSGHGQGGWQFSTDGGTSWNDIGAVSDNSALLLRSTDLVRFLPDAQNGNTGTITFRAWDQTGATLGQQGTKVDTTANGGITPFSTAIGSSAITALDVNDAPVLDPTQTQPFTTITEDDVNNGGNTVASLLGTSVSDIDFGAVQGLAITATTVSGHGQGGWQFSTDGGTSWNDIGAVSDNSALLLRSTDLVRFLPDGQNGNTGTITFRAWDQTGATLGQQGTKVDTTANGGITPFSTAIGSSGITALDVNDAPVLDPTQTQPFTTITEDDVSNPGDTVASLLGASVSDVDFGAVQGIAITAATVSGPGQGRWQFSTNGGTSWNDIGAVSDSSALLLRPTDLVRLLPDSKNGDTGTITFRAWDQTGATLGQQGTKVDTTANGGTTPFSVVTGTSAIIVQDVNDAPVLDPAQVQSFTTITEDDVNNSGDTVASLLGSSVTDVDFGAIQGIAVTATSVTGHGQGRWQYSTDGGADWNDIGTVSDTSALLLRSTDRVRFLPDAKNGDTGTITFRAWDQTAPTAGQQGTKVDASTNGGITPFSTASGTSAIIVQDVNDAPVLDPTQVQPLSTITEDDISNSGNTVASLLAGSTTDVDFGAVQGIAISGTAVTGTRTGTATWQFSTNGGASWNDFGPVSDTSALVLRSTDLVRVLPDQANGNTFSITYRAWDQSGATTGKQGTKFDTSTLGGISPFSLAKATSTILVQDLNDAPVITPQTIFLPASATGSVGVADGRGVSLPWSYTDKDLPLLTPPFTWAITGGNNGAFAIDPLTGAISVANAALFTYSNAPVALTVAAVESEFPGAPAIGTQQFTIQPWTVTTSATQINNQQATTLTIQLNSGVSHQFTGMISWGDEATTGREPQLVTITSNVPLQVSHTFTANPSRANAAAPIPIEITVVPTGEASAISATATATASVPGNVFAAVKLNDTSTTGFVEAAQPIILSAPSQTTSPLSTVSQTTAAGASTAEATNTDERLYALRLVSPSETEEKDIVLTDPKDLAVLMGANRAFKMNDTDLDDLPTLFKKLPDGRYQVYLAEEGHLRLVIDVIVRQGRAVDPTDDSGGRDRPPTGQIEVGHPDPIVEIKAQFQRAVNGRKTDVPEAQPIDTSFVPDQPNWFVAPATPADAVVAVRTNSHAARLARPSDDRAPSRQSSAEASDTNHWTAPAAAAGAAIAIGAGAVLSREERIDRAMQELDPRSLSKGARLVRWLKRNR